MTVARGHRQASLDAQSPQRLVQRRHRDLAVAPDRLPEPLDRQSLRAGVEQAHQQRAVQRREVAHGVVDQAGERAEGVDLPAARDRALDDVEQAPRQRRAGGRRHEQAPVRRDKAQQQGLGQRRSAGGEDLPLRGGARPARALECDSGAQQRGVGALGRAQVGLDGSCIGDQVGDLGRAGVRPL